MKEEIKALFDTYPDATVLYQDGNGVLWLSKETAEAQTPNEVKEIQKIETKKKIKNDSENNN